MGSAELARRLDIHGARTPTDMKNKSSIIRFSLAATVAFVASAGIAANAKTSVDSPSSSVPTMERDAEDTLQAKRERLPREWRWQGKAHNFNGMFRSR